MGWKEASKLRDPDAVKKFELGSDEKKIQRYFTRYKWVSTRKQENPFPFAIGSSKYRKVIPGLDLGVAQMSLGEKALLYVPSGLAYEPSGTDIRFGKGGVIPHDTDLIYEIELLSINGQ